MRVLIIGATSAVAQQVAKGFAGQQAQIFCIARNREQMQQLAGSCSRAIKGFHCCEFTDHEAVTAAVAEAVSCLGGFDCVLIAHGYLPEQIATESDIAMVNQTFAVNCLSVIDLLMPIVEQLRQQGSGKVGVITSVAGDRGRPRNFTYGAAKGALAIYLQGLRSVLHDTGVEVYTFKLGPVDTPMTVDHEKNFSFTTADKAAAAMLKAFNGSRYEVYVPGFWRWVMLAVRNMPEWLFQKLGFLSDR